MRLSATHAFNCIVLRVKFGLTSFEDIPPALTYIQINNTHVYKQMTDTQTNKQYTYKYSYKQINNTHTNK